MNVGITVDENGTFCMNGKPFYAYGVNAYTLIWDQWTKPGDTGYIEGFAMLQKYNIPFVRLPLSCITIEQFRAYEENPETYFSVLDKIFAEAEKNKVGVVGYIVASFRFVGMLGERPAALGDVNSKSLKFAKKFAADIAKRYANHPAVWGYEVITEPNHYADIYYEESPRRKEYMKQVFGSVSEAHNGFDSMTFDEITTCKREIAKSIREHDPYRMISTGDSIQRPNSYALRETALSTMQNAGTPDRVWQGSGVMNTREQLREMVEYSTPDPINVVEAHMGMAGFPSWEVCTYDMREGKVHYSEVYKQYVDIAKKAKKGLYIAEFGFMGNEGEKVDPALVRDMMPKHLQTMVATGVQLASLWQFNGYNDLFNDEGNLGYIFSEITKVNDGFVRAGLQDKNGIW